MQWQGALPRQGCLVGMFWLRLLCAGQRRLSQLVQPAHRHTRTNAKIVLPGTYLAAGPLAAQGGETCVFVMRGLAISSSLFAPSPARMLICQLTAGSFWTTASQHHPSRTLPQKDILVEIKLTIPIKITAAAPAASVSFAAIDDAIAAVADVASAAAVANAAAAVDALITFLR